MNTGVCGNKILTKITRKQKGARVGTERMQDARFLKSTVYDFVEVFRLVFVLISFVASW